MAIPPVFPVSVDVITLLVIVASPVVVTLLVVAVLNVVIVLVVESTVVEVATCVVESVVERDVAMSTVVVESIGPPAEAESSGTGFSAHAVNTVTEKKTEQKICVAHGVLG
jgi:hypothetical protein